MQLNPYKIYKDAVRTLVQDAESKAEKITVEEFEEFLKDGRLGDLEYQIWDAIKKNTGSGNEVVVFCRVLEALAENVEKFATGFKSDKQPS